MGVLKDLETFILTPALLSRLGCPSASIALLTPPGHISAHVISAAPNRETADADTVYQAASISKAITALGVARLVDAGVIGYETRVAGHVPAEIAREVTEGGAAMEGLFEAVTVGMLVSHRSGMGLHGFMGYGEDKGMGGEAGLPGYEEMFGGKGRANHPPIRFESFPGSQMSYSGGGFVLLQAFLEEVTGEGFGDLMHRLVLGPLGMTRSRFGELEEGERNFARAHWTATHAGVAGEKGYWRLPELAAAGLWTTPSDLLRAVMAVQRSLDPAPGQEGVFLSAATARRMLEMPEPREKDEEMAMGWFTDENFFAHSGENFPGYVSYVFGSKGEVVGQNTSISWRAGQSQAGTGIAVMINSYEGYETIRRIVSAIFAFNTWSRGGSLPSFGPFEEIVPFPGPEGIYMPPGFCNEIVGKWEDGWEILHDDRGGLEVAFGDGLAPMRLRPGAMSPHLLDGTKQLFVVVDGLNVALSLTTDPETNERMLMVVQNKVKKVRRLAPAAGTMDHGQHATAA